MRIYWNGSGSATLLCSIVIFCERCALDRNSGLNGYIWNDFKVDWYAIQNFQNKHLSTLLLNGRVCTLTGSIYDIYQVFLHSGEYSLSKSLVQFSWYAHYIKCTCNTTCIIDLRKLICRCTVQTNYMIP